MMSQTRHFGVYLFAALLFVNGAALAANVPSDDTAKFLAGMQVPAGSPLEPFTKDRGWQQHAKYLDGAWGALEESQLSKVRSWSAKNLVQPAPVLYYMFSGPDFLYADSFFPNASTYVLSGLEPAGPIPDVASLPAHAIVAELAAIDASLHTVLRTSYFITNEMSRRLFSHRLAGTLPVLYVFLARTGHTIDEVSLVAIDNDGRIHPAAEQPPAKGAPRGVKIVFSKGSGPKKTLYYFQTDLSNQGVNASGYLKFCESLGRGDALIKSASYLPHSSGFSSVRDFLLNNANSIVQDDTGIPAQLFDQRDWELRAFGNYLRPIRVFAGLYQPKLAELFRKGKAGDLDFGLGYHVKPAASNLLLAVKTMRAAAKQ